MLKRGKIQPIFPFLEIWKEKIERFKKVDRTTVVTLRARLTLAWMIMPISTLYDRIINIKISGYLFLTSNNMIEQIFGLHFRCHTSKSVWSSNFELSICPWKTREYLRKSAFPNVSAPPGISCDLNIWLECIFVLSKRGKLW